MRRRLTASFAFGLVLIALVAGSTLAETVVTSGPRTLTVSRDAGLDPAGEMIEVRGAGYDEHRGIYVAFCVITDPEVAPGPCGGGIDTAGASGSSVWISSNPPPYGKGLALPYESGGSFVVTLRVSATIGTDVDCSVTRCAVVTRNDHTRSDDRGQDVVVPVTFRAGGGGLVGPASAGVAPWVGLGLGILVLAFMGVAIGRRRRRGMTASDRVGPDAS